MTGTRNPYQRKKDAPRVRLILALSLCILLPPLGLIYIWRAGLFRVRGRVFLSCLSGVEMTLLLAWGLFGLISWSGMPPTVLPLPSVSQAVTASPDDETLNALTNIDELIAKGVREVDETVAPDATPSLTQAEEEALKEEVYNTVVYSVYSGAKYYHTSTVCGNQSNRRSLTVREAILEGLGACPDCDPPVP